MPRPVFIGALALSAFVVCSCGGGPSAASAREEALVEDEDQSFVDWVELTARPIESLVPGEEFGGLDGLGEIVGQARVIAVGEPVYGAKEIFRVKRRMFEYLVRTRGVRTMVADVGWAEALAIDDFLRTGEGNPEELLTRLRTWTWNTSEALDLVWWMRRYNETVPSASRIHFYGADALYTSVSAAAVRAYLEEVDGEFLQRVDESLRFFSEPESDQKYARLRTRDGERLILDLERTLDRLWRKRRPYADASSQAEWAVVEHHGQLARQALEIRRASRGGSSGALREKFLAENVRWILDREETGDRVFLWSHNSRVSVESLKDGERMGRHLQRFFGSDLVVIGVLFNRGSFLARTSGREVVEVEIGPAPEGTFEHSLSKVEHPAMLVDLRRSTDAVDQWLMSERLTRETGLRFSDPNSMTRPRTLGRRFDAIVWVNTTTASRLTSGWVRSAAASGEESG
jgi:erythromycin esterase